MHRGRSVLVLGYRIGAVLKEPYEIDTTERYRLLDATKVSVPGVPRILAVIYA